jgi:Transglycosylase SLT domain
MHTAAPLAAPSDPQVVHAVRAASEATGVSFEYLLAQANQESGLDPHASSSSSSASGLFQFTASTWMDMVKRHGAEHGLGADASAITKGGDGQWHVAEANRRHAILELRRDPKLSAMMAAEYAKDNGRVLEKKLGRPASSSDLYLAHFLGASGAAKVLGAAPTHEAAPLLPAAARANPDLFHDSGSGQPRTVAALYGMVQKRLAGAMSEVAPIARKAELASLRPRPRPSDEPTTIIATAAAPVLQLPEPLAITPVAKRPDPATPFFPVAIPPATTAATRQPNSEEPFRA